MGEAWTRSRLRRVMRNGGATRWRLSLAAWARTRKSSTSLTWMRNWGTQANLRDWNKSRSTNNFFGAGGVGVAPGDRRRSSELLSSSLERPGSEFQVLLLLLLLLLLLVVVFQEGQRLGSEFQVLLLLLLLLLVVVFQEGQRLGSEFQVLLLLLLLVVVFQEGHWLRSTLERRTRRRATVRAPAPSRSTASTTPVSTVEQCVGQCSSRSSPARPPQLRATLERGWRRPHDDDDDDGTLRRRDADASAAASAATTTSTSEILISPRVSGTLWNTRTPSMSSEPKTRAEPKKEAPTHQVFVEFFLLFVFLMFQNVFQGAKSRHFGTLAHCR